MRIALVSFAGAPDAPELAWPDGHIPALAEALTQRGDDVVLFARHQSEPIGGRPPDTPYRVVRLAAGRPVPLGEADATTHLGEYIAALSDELRRLRPDVVHSHTWLAGLATHLASRQSPVPVAHTFHRLQLSVPRRRTGQLQPASQVRAERAVAFHADRVIALSRVERELLIHAGLAQRRIAVVPPGVDTERLCPEGPRDERGAPHRLVLFGSVRQAAPVVRALTALPDTELIILDTAALPGRPDAADANRLAALAATLHVGNRVSVLAEPGTPDRRATLVRSADLVISYAAPHRWTHGHLEAMACGVPVVAASPQAEEAVVDGVTGVHATDSDPRQLAKTLRSLIDAGTLRQGMGLAGRDRATGRYSWSRIASETARVYEELVSADADRAATADSAAAEHAPAVQ